MPLDLTNSLKRLNDELTTEEDEAIKNASLYPRFLVENVPVIKIPVAVGDAVIVTLTAFWPLFLLPTDAEKNEFINFHQYIANADMIMKDWCFYFGQSRALSKNCTTHKTCKTLRESFNISNEGDKVLTVFKNCLKVFIEKKINKRKRIKHMTEEAQPYYVSWPVIGGEYKNCISCELNPQTDEYVFRLKTQISGLKWVKSNGSFVGSCFPDLLLKRMLGDVTIAAIDVNVMQLNSLTLIAGSYDSDEEIDNSDMKETNYTKDTIAVLHSSNVKFLYEDHTQFVLYCVTFDINTDSNVLRTFKTLVKAVMYGNGFNKCTFDVVADNELYFIGKIQNQDLNLKDKLSTLGEMFNIQISLYQEKDIKFHNIKSISLLSSALGIETKLKTDISIDNISCFDFKQFVKQLVGDYNVKVSDISIEFVSFVDEINVTGICNFKCSVYGLHKKFVYNLLREARANSLLSKSVKITNL
jgi:hypothetical protein